MKKIKQRILDWLGLYTKSEVDEKIAELKSSTSAEISAMKKMNNLNFGDLFKRVNSIESLVQIGVSSGLPERRMRTNSWAVVCIAGKQHYVKFHTVKESDARAIHEFLRQFEVHDIKYDGGVGEINYLLHERPDLKYNWPNRS